VNSSPHKENAPSVFASVLDGQSLSVFSGSGPYAHAANLSARPLRPRSVSGYGRVGSTRREPGSLPAKPPEIERLRALIAVFPPAYIITERARWVSRRRECPGPDGHRIEDRRNSDRRPWTPKLLESTAPATES